MTEGKRLCENPLKAGRYEGDFPIAGELTRVYGGIFFCDFRSSVFRILMP